MQKNKHLLSTATSITDLQHQHKQQPIKNPTTPNRIHRSRIAQQFIFFYIYGIYYS